MMFSFENERRRKINLGGASASSSQTSIFERVQAERQARAEHKRRTESATQIQAFYRGSKEKHAARAEMRKAFEADVLSLTGLRCLVLMGQDDEVLTTWVQRVLEGGEGQVFAPAKGAHATSYAVLVRQTAFLLLKSVSNDPKNTRSLQYLQLLNTLLSVESAETALGGDGQPFVHLIIDYLLRHRFYDLLSEGIRQIPTKDKKSPALALLLDLALRPLSAFPQSAPQYSQCLGALFARVFTIPLLPNRLPLETLPSFVASLPLKNLEVLQPHMSTILTSTSLEEKIHLMANLHMFISPHYSLLPSPALQTYLKLSASLLNAFPTALFDPPEKQKKGIKKGSTSGYDSQDSDEHGTRVTVVSFFDFFPIPIALPKIDEKTLKRLQSIVGVQHLTNLINVTQSKSTLFPDLISYLFAATSAWSSTNTQILHVVLASTGGAFVREIYRDLVRTSPLGRDAGYGTLIEPANASHYPPLLFLVDLYSQALLTMGDDEFFGTSPAGSANRSQRNPLTLDELKSFSRQLLNIAFALYWRDESGGALAETYISRDIRCTWEAVREKVTRCLLGIHARDSRKPFVPPDHWLVTSQLDMNSFVEAAVLEEQSLSSNSDESNHRTLSKRQLASISPRLGILNNIPFSIPFEVRVSIFRHFVVNDMMARGSMESHGSWNSRADPFFRRRGHDSKTRVQVRRGMVSQDGFDRLGDVDLKGPIEISFIDQFGQEEAGIDGGGVFKEFFTSLCKEVFDTDRGLWLATKKNELYPNPHSYATESHSLNWYRFIGRILGKAMYEGILVDVAFAGFFLSKWLGRQSFLDDLSSLDPELYNGLIFLKHYAGNPEDLSLNFTVAVDEFGVTKSIDLIPDGSNIAVTKDNRLQYIQLVSHYRLNKQIRKQSDAFFDGLSEMIDQKWLRMFNQQEVQILIGGVNTPIDIVDLQQHTNYGGLYDAHHPTIQMFWRVVESLDAEQKRSLLRFVTSCSRPPLLGFRELVPNFSIRDAGDDQYRLPTSSTCVNLLKLPRYTNERNLKTKLIQAINAGAGFDLS
ncbi:HECT-domain-containing protein [Crepidotus variabilis]|uniref:HECT-type E3 ubiquitin transferase n=1 Tax=Crepidotus variabilis TaxID=179855 RepID=A0A9P6JIP4_9AGAR|nr:HECT-domain-containing protein [Crepidotus variabilis]